jgi:hypothetical protein
MFGPVGAAGWRGDALLVSALWGLDVSIGSSSDDCTSVCVWWRVVSGICSACSSLSWSSAVNVFVGDVAIGDVAVLLSADDWRLLVFEADPLGTSTVFCWRTSRSGRGSGEWDLFSVSGSCLALAGEVGDPIGRVIAASLLRLGVLAFLVDVALFTLFASSLTLFLALLLALLCSFLQFLFSRVFAFVVADVLVWEVALGRPHMIVGGAAKSEREDAQTEIVEATDCH